MLIRELPRQLRQKLAEVRAKKEQGAESKRIKFSKRAIARKGERSKHITWIRGYSANSIPSPETVKNLTNRRGLANLWLEFKTESSVRKANVLVEFDPSNMSSKKNYGEIHVQTFAGDFELILPNPSRRALTEYIKQIIHHQLGRGNFPESSPLLYAIFVKPKLKKAA